MNYRHLYHAGSFADVIKHFVLTLLLQQFLKKDAGFCFIDSHAGQGLYDLGSYEARATNEASNGVLRLPVLETDIPEWLKPYWKIVHALQPADKITLYPGSPLIARDFLRPQDKMILNEKHEETYNELKNFFYRDRQATLHQRDAYEFLPAVLPPKDYARALILIDPPFEKITEKADLTEALAKCMKRFAHGMYAIWFPLTEKMPHLEIDKALKSLLPSDKNLLLEFTVNDPASIEKGLLGCAMIIINPPWDLKATLEKALPSLWNMLSARGQGTWRLFSMDKVGDV